jgi:hypothetical protein
MTKDTLAIGSTDLLALAETVSVTVGPSPERYEHSYEKSSYPAPKWATKMLDYTWQSVQDMTVRPEHRDLTVWQFDWSRTFVTPSGSCSITVFNDLIKRALRTYPKRMSRAKRKEARARERRRVEQYNQWWSKR